jgi:predicted amidohydrolase
LKLLRITLIQTPLIWEDREANISLIDAAIEQIGEPTDLVVLPEMFTTGFSMHPEQFAEDFNGPTVAWMKQRAKAQQVALAGSMMMQDKGKYYNTLVFMHPDGHADFYRKRHLFTLGEEHAHYTAGGKQVMIEYKGYHILLAVCYDLRFPVWLRRTPAMNYDLLLLVANWPERRNTHWKNLIQARAIENQSYVAAVNRVGEDGNGVAHSGDSALINAKGEILFQLANQPFVKTFSIEKDETNAYRLSFNLLADADTFTLL